MQEPQRKSRERGQEHGANLLQTTTKLRDVIPLLTLDAQVMNNAREWIKAGAITDDGCQFNAIKRILVTQLGFKTSGRPPTAVNFDGKHLQVYGCTDIQLKVKDTSNKVKRTKETFLAVHDAPEDIILGLPFLVKHNPYRSYAAKSLRMDRAHVASEGATS